MVRALHSARTRFFDKCGKPLCGGTVHTYQVGTTTAKPTYTDVSKTAVNTNPVILDSIGSADIFLDGAYRVRVLDRNGVLVEDIAYVESWISESQKDDIYKSLGEVSSQLLGEINKKAGIEYVGQQLAAVNEQLDLKADQETTYTKIEVDSALSTKAPQATTYSRTEVDTKFSAYVGGRKAYTTLALAQADQVNLTANTAIEVTNDGSNNGTYQWNGTTLTKSDYDPLAQTKQFIDVLSNTNQRQAATFYYAPSNIIVKETNSGLFAVSIKVKPKQKYVFNTKSFGVVGSYYIADASGNVLQTLSSSETLAQDYVIEIPATGVMLYVNCLYSYADFKCYLLNNELSNLAFSDVGVSNFQFYSASSGVVVNSNSGFFSKTYDVVAGEYYLIRNATYGTAPQYIIANSSGEVIALEPSGNRGKNYFIHIPKNAAKLYVNCAYTAN